MKNKRAKLLIPVIASIALSGCDFLGNGPIGSFFKNLFGGEDVPSGTNSLSKTSGYYKDYDLDLTGPLLEEELQRMCFEKHKNYVLYTNVNSYYAKKTTNGKVINSVEAIADGSTTNQWFYTGKEASGYGTREHVWPCANSGSLWVHDKTEDHVHNVDKSTYVGGGSDLFHIRTANTNVNTARGNSKFVDFDDPEFENIRSEVFDYTENNGKYPLKIQGYKINAHGGKEYSQKCEPADQMKGDIARIIMYVWIHYGTHGYVPDGYADKNHKYKLTDTIGSLSLTNIFGYGSIERCAKEIAEWNQIDPPSDVEKLRNNTVQGVQGNRNMFVDFPELIDQLFDDYLD